MRTLDSNEFVYEDEASLPSSASVSSTEPKPVSDFTFEEEPSFLKSVGQTAQDALVSAAQEGSFGFSDEGIAMSRAILDSARGKGDRKSLYEKYLAEERERIKTAEERSPIASTIGGLSGAAVPALMSGGTSGLLTGTRMLPAAARLLGAGAVGGAVSAIGKSEEEIGKETVKEALTGAAEGAAITGAFGVAGKAAGAGFNLLKGSLKSTNIGRQALLAKELAKEGVDITSPEFETRSKGAAKGVAQKIYGALSGIGTDIDQALVSAEKQGIKILADDSNLEALEKGIKALDENKLLGSETPSFMEKFSGLFSKVDPRTGAVVKSGLNPVEANELRKKIRDALADAAEKGKLAFNDYEKISELNRVLKDKLNLIPDFKKSNEFYEEFARKVPATAGGRGIQETVEFVNPVTGEVKKIKTGISSFSEKTFSEVQKDIESLINKIYAGGVAKKDQVAAFQELEKNLKGMDSETLKRYGINADELISTIKKEADISKIGAGIFGVESQDSVKKQVGKVASPSGAVFRAAGLIGEAQAGISKAAAATPSVVKKPLELSKALFNLPITGLESLGGKLASSPSKKLSDFGNYLVKNSKTDADLKRKAMFLILQDPDLRDSIVPYLGED